MLQIFGQLVTIGLTLSAVKADTGDDIKNFLLNHHSDLFKKEDPASGPQFVPGISTGLWNFAPDADSHVRLKGNGKLCYRCDKNVDDSKWQALEKAGNCTVVDECRQNRKCVVYSHNYKNKDGDNDVYFYKGCAHSCENARGFVKRNSNFKCYDCENNLCNYLPLDYVWTHRSELLNFDDNLRE